MLTKLFNRNETLVPLLNRNGTNQQGSNIFQKRCCIHVLTGVSKSYRPCIVSPSISVYNQHSHRIEVAAAQVNVEVEEVFHKRHISTFSPFSENKF